MFLGFRLIVFIMIIMSVSIGNSAQQTIESLETWSDIRDKLNENYTELYAADATFTAYMSAFTPTAVGIAIGEAATYAEVAALLLVGKQEQTESIDNLGVLIPDQADELTIFVTGTANPTYITFQESGNEASGDRIKIINSGSTNIVFQDQSAVLELDGTYNIEPGGVLNLVYDTATWRQDGKPSGTDLYIGDVNLYDASSSTCGLVQGGIKCIVSTTDRELDIDEMGGFVLFKGTGAKVLSIQPNLFTVAQGAGVRVGRIGTAQVDINILDSTVPVLPTGVELDAGDMVRLGAASGSVVELLGIEAGKVHTFTIAGDAPTDGGVLAGGCALFDSYEVTEDNNFAVAYSAANRVYIGTTITPDASTDICQVDFKCSTITGSVSSYDYYFRLYAMSGTNINTASVLGTSDKIDGGDISAGSWIVGTFSSDITTSGTYALVLYAVANGDGADGTRIYNSSNFITGSLTVDTDAGDMADGKIATDGLQRWGTDGARSYYDATDDILVRAYGVLTP